MVSSRFCSVRYRSATPSESYAPSGGGIAYSTPGIGPEVGTSGVTGVAGEADAGDRGGALSLIVGAVLTAVWYLTVNVAAGVMSPLPLLQFHARCSSNTMSCVTCSLLATVS